jgi:hypothetical protein
VLRRTLAAVAVLAAVAAVIPATGLAARVSVRVEGKTQTIFGKAPRALDASNALEALGRAADAGEFFVNTRATAFGPYVEQIGRYPATASSGWVFKVNGASPPVGADSVTLRDGDTVLWYWADFDAATGAGPRTLLLEKTSAHCYAAFLQDDTGTRTAATGVRVWISGTPRRTAASGRFCLASRPLGLVHVTRAGAVRSNGVR